MSSIKHKFQSHANSRIQRMAKREIKRLLNPKYGERVGRYRHYSKVGVFFKHQEKVLELGCGPGAYVALLHSLGLEVTAVDPYAFKEWEIFENRNKIKLNSGIWAEHLPFENSKFDSVAFLGTLLYTSSPRKAMEEIHRVLKPSGKLLIRSVNKSNLYTRRTSKPIDPNSSHLFTMDELIQLVQECGFTVKESYAFGYWPPFLPQVWWYLQKTWLPIWLISLLSFLTPQKYRVNNFVFANRNV